jgi:hypothetical protein
MSIPGMPPQRRPRRSFEGVQRMRLTWSIMGPGWGNAGSAQAPTLLGTVRVFFRHPCVDSDCPRTTMYGRGSVDPQK